MKHLEISSKENPKFSYLSKLILDSTFRNAEPRFVLEHASAIQEHLARHPDQVEAIIISKEGLIPEIPKSFSGEIWQFSNALFSKLTTTKTPGALLALLKKPVFPTLDSLFSTASLLVGLDRIQDPGNAGAIVRNAVAFGADGVLFFSGTASPFHPQTLRGMAGNCFDIPLISCEQTEIIPFLQSWHVAGLDPKATHPIQAAFTHPKTLLILGSEGQGLSEQLPQMTRYTIPTHRPIESLNVSVASGIALFISRTHPV